MVAECISKCNSFAPKDLLAHVRLLVNKLSNRAEKGSNSNYAWLRSRHISVSEDGALDKFERAVSKLSSESCAAIAVKLDTLTDGAKMSAGDVIKLFERLLAEQETIELLNLVGKKKIKTDLGKRRATIAFISV